MTEIANPVSISKHSQEFFAEHVPGPKSLGSSQAKALGADTGLAAWYEQAYSYYQQVSSGAAPMPDTAAWNELLQQMTWAYEQLQGSSYPGDAWGIDDSWYLEEDPFASPQGGDPYGGQVGPSGNLIHNRASAELGLVGGVTREIWSDEINIRIPSLSAQVEAVLTQDDSVQPPEMIMKIKVSDPATGQSDTYIVHDYEDAKVNVFTPEADQVQDDQGLLNWQSYQEATSVDMSEAVNVPVETLEDGSYLVEAPMGEVIDFTPPWNPNGAENQTWELWGDFNLNLRPSDRLQVSAGTPNDPDGFTLRITRRNGQVITLHTHEGFQGNLNANPENITWGGQPGSLSLPDGVVSDTVLDESLSTDPGATPLPPAGPGDEEDAGVPPEFAEHFTLNGEDFSESEYDVEAAGDPPTKTEGGKRIYDGQDFEISPVPEGEGRETIVMASGTVTITPNSNMEFYEMTYNPESGDYILMIYTDESKGTLKETIRIDGELVDKIHLKVDPSRYTFMHQEGEGSDVEEKIQIGDGTQSEDEATLPNFEEIMANLPPYIVNRLGMQEAVALFDAAVQSGKPEDWQQFTDHLKGMKDKYANDTIRSLVTSLYRFAGNNYVELKELLNLIPQEVREAMKGALSDKISELDEKHEGELWNSKDTWELIDSTL